MSDTEPKTTMTAWKRLMEPVDSSSSSYERAEVARVRISESGATKRKRLEERGNTQRKRIEEREKTKQAKAGNEMYQVIRGIGMAVLAVLALCSTCVGYHAVDAWQDVKDKQISASVTTQVPPAQYTLTVAPVAPK